MLPRALKEGDVVGVAAPAGPFGPERFEAGLARLESLGLRPRYDEQVFARDGFLAGADETRARALNALWADEEVKAVMGARGGYGSMRLLDRLDFEAWRARPRILVGFSDLTALLLAVHQATGLVTFHGPVVTSLAEADEATLSHLGRLLFGQPVFPLALDQAEVLVPGRAEGPLLGGNLTLLVHLLATPYLPDLSGAVLFLEDTDEAPYRLDRMLTALKLAGVLARCAGVILGRFTDCGPEDQVRRVLARTLAEFAGPVVAGFPAGHGPTNLALPLGVRAVLDTEAGVLETAETFLA